MNERRLLYRPDGEPRLALPGLAVLVATIALSLGVATLARHERSQDQRAGVLSATGQYALAEAIYTRMLGANPSVPLLLAFLENHARGELDDARRHTDQDVADGKRQNMMTEDAVEGLLSRLPPDVLLVARFVRAKEPAPTDVRDAIVAGAERDPPVPWYNHLLAGDALQRHELSEAATYFEREGLAFPDRHDDVDTALDVWMSADDWDHVRLRMRDPRVRAAADPETKERFALHERDWLAAARWMALGWGSKLTWSSFAMSGTAALAWGFFCARLGKIGERPKRRFVFYIAAFALGVLSVVPTLLLITVEETKLRLVETGDPARDVLYFVFGVGLREEACKLLLFSPLLFLVRKWGDKVDVLVCGALVGLGFAAEENLGYLASGDLHTGLGRFLTANFLHMAMTGILATSLDDFVTDSERFGADFSRTSLLVVALHGAYDFLLSHEEYGGSYMAMAVFVFLARMFLGAMDRARRRVDRGLSLLHSFVFAAAVVTGVSAVYASVAVGPVQAGVVMSEGLLGEAIIFAVFVRSLRGM
jgi:RsiW-degrading membrane proteinase PrsW (M82 family)